MEGIMRSAFDFSPLFRSTVGFDRLPSLLETAARLDEATVSYPPYNIEKVDEDAYRISMAVAGFGEGDLEIEAKEQTLLVTGRQPKSNEEKTYLHHGIAARSFKHSFQIADHVKVTGARLENGLLHIDLVREIPEAMKPRQIRIETVEPKAIAADTKKTTKEPKKAA